MNQIETDRLALSKTQKEAFDRALRGESFFLTGEAGSGKTFLLAKILKHYEGEFAVVAPTGIAAQNAESFLRSNEIFDPVYTIHKFFGFSHRTRKNFTVENKIFSEKIRQLKLLVIDEVSMTRADLFDSIDHYLSNYGPNPGELFGGVQLLLVGDIFQLPPVVARKEVKYIEHHYESPYFFSSDAAFMLGIRNNVQNLKENFRQAGDDEFISSLNALRAGFLPVGGFRKNISDGGVLSDEMVMLTSTRKRAREYNDYFLNSLGEKIHSSKALVEGRLGSSLKPYEKELHFSAKSRVLMLKNDKDKRFVNGSRGSILEIRTGALNEPIEVQIRLDSGEIVCVAPDTWEVYETYFYEPKKELRNTLIGKMTQFPFTLGWALTVHKAQGLSLKEVYIDLERALFAPGQAYVGLSRATTLNGLKISRELTQDDIIVDKSAINFYQEFVREQ